MVFVTQSYPPFHPTHLRINAHRYLLYKIRILVFQAMSTIFTGLFSRGSVGIVGFHICLSSSFTIFRFFRGGKPFQCHKLPTLQRQNEFIFSGLSRGVNLLFSPFVTFRLTSLFSQYMMNMSCIFFLYSFSRITTLHQR